VSDGQLSCDSLGVGYRCSMSSKYV
jgi:hypothetical protein